MTFFASIPPQIHYKKSFHKFEKYGVALSRLLEFLFMLFLENTEHFLCGYGQIFRVRLFRGWKNTG